MAECPICEGMCCASGAGETILDTAQRAVYGERAADYGHPRDHWGRTVATLNARGWRREGRELTAQDWGEAMIEEKLSRLAHTPEHRDTLVDVVGYAAAIERLGEPE